MKVAVLILAHKNKEQLEKLVSHLECDFRVYVHIDKRSKWTIPGNDKVHVLEKRYPVYWGASTIPLAVLELLKHAHRDNCDYYMLISGQDIPLMSNRDILSYLETHYKDLMSFTPLPKAGWDYNGGIDRLALYWETKYESNKDRLGYLRNLPLKGSFWLLRWVQRNTNLRRNIPFKLWGGEMWLNLTKEAVSYILDFLDENQWYFKHFKFTRASDELFFQTLLKSFDYAGRDNIENEHMRYIDWTSGPEYPKLLTIEDYQACMHSGKFFGRKFDRQKDSKVIDKLLTATKSEGN